MGVFSSLGSRTKSEGVRSDPIDLCPAEITRNFHNWMLWLWSMKGNILTLFTFEFIIYLLVCSNISLKLSAVMLTEQLRLHSAVLNRSVNSGVRLSRSSHQNIPTQHIPFTSPNRITDTQPQRASARDCDDPNKFYKIFI